MSTHLVECLNIWQTDPKNYWAGHEETPILSAEIEMIKTQNNSFAFP